MHRWTHKRDDEGGDLIEKTKSHGPEFFGRLSTWRHHMYDVVNTMAWGVSIVCTHGAQKPQSRAGMDAVQRQTSNPWKPTTRYPVRCVHITNDPSFG